MQKKANMQPTGLKRNLIKNETILNNKLNVAYITDENYVLPTIVSITSLFVNKRKSSNYEVSIITNNISKKIGVIEKFTERIGQHCYN